MNVFQKDGDFKPVLVGKLGGKSREESKECREAGVEGCAGGKDNEKKGDDRPAHT